MVASNDYEAVIGLEVHAQLLTESKVFCSCTTKFGSEPNSNVCPICLGMPGVLPVLNRNAVEFAIRVGLATHCTIAHRSIFARKNYFYPDLPKGYQISQYEEPICTRGAVGIEWENGTRKTIGITRIHMEEDAGKSIHDISADTLVDINRCGVPLIEIVSEPDLGSPHEAYLYLHAIRQIVTYLGICDGNMEEGSLRCDANVSVRRKGETKLGTKTEVKNMNSFRNVERALEYEIKRQIGVLESGGRILQETLLWDANQNVAVSMRSKEEAHDYRYFPEPDLLPVVVDDAWIERVRKELPELPLVRRDRFVEEYGVPAYDAGVLTEEKFMGDYFEAVCASLSARTKDQFKAASNWMMGEVLRVLRDTKIPIDEFRVSPKNLAGLLNLIADGTVSGTLAKEVFEAMLESDTPPREIVEAKGLMQVRDEGAIEKIVETVIAENVEQVQKYLDGKEQVFGFLVGQAMRASKGKANPKLLNETLRRKLESLHTAQRPG